MRRLFFRVAILLLGIISFTPSMASAQEFNHTITVYAVVPEQRVIYIDGSGNLIKAAGNTSDNIVPKVLDPKNNEVPITPSIQSQYDQLLAQNNNRLAAGRTYRPNPVNVINTINTQVIKIDLSGLTLGSGQNG